MTTTNNSASHQDEPATYVREVTARYIGPRRRSCIITSSDIAAKFMRRLLRDHAREHFLALYLSSAHRVISYSLVSLGSANATPAHPREVFQPAVLVGACAIIVGHNHPSGDTCESPEDIIATKKLKEAAAILGIKFLDHIIFTADSHNSLNEKGLLD